MQSERVHNFTIRYIMMFTILIEGLVEVCVYISVISLLVLLYLLVFIRRSFR